MSPTLAGPPGDCCRKTVQHVGEVRGKMATVAGAHTYITAPADGSNKKIILFFADIWGARYINSHLVMDYWADNGYLVLAIDYFEGDSIENYDRDSTSFDFQGWIKAMQDKADRLLPPWIEAVKRDYGSDDTKYVCVGYCFGAPYVMDYLTTDWMLAGAFAHPAFLDDAHFENVKKPILLSCAELDHLFPLDSRRRAEDILIAKKATYTMQVFGQVDHGFALRGDPSVSAQKWAKEESARSILHWFDHFCSLNE